MPGAAVVRRELGALLRRPVTHWLQGLFVLLLSAVVVGAWAMRWGPGEAMHYAEMSAIGQRLFELLFVGELVGVSLAAPLVTGGVIAEERRRRTLDLLLLTDLGDFQIVVGKFLSRTFYLMLIIFLATPVLLACLAFGGVSATDVLEATALVASAALWSSAIGLFFSSWSRQGYHAIVRAYVVLLGMGLIPVAFALALGDEGCRPDRPLDFILSPIAYGVGRLLFPGRPGFWEPGAWPLLAAATLGASLLLVAISVALVRRIGSASRLALQGDATGTWRLQARSVRRHLHPPGWRRIWLEAVLLRLVVGGIAVALAVTAPWTLMRTQGLAWIPLLGLVAVVGRLVWDSSRPPPCRLPVWDNPVAWKEVVVHRSPTVRVGILVGVLLVVALLYVCLASLHDAAFDARLHACLVAWESALAVVVTVLFGIVAFARDAENGHLELLLGTPLPAWKIVAGKFAGVGATVAPLAGFAFFHLVAATAAGVFTPAQAAAASAMILALGWFHAAFALLLGLWLRRTGVVLGVYFAGALAVYGMVPVLLPLLFTPDLSVPDMYSPCVDPLGAIEQVLVSGASGRPGLIEGFLGFHVVEGTALVILVLWGFDRLVRRRSRP